MNLDIYILSKPPSPWGDYGDILHHGMSTHSDVDEQGRISLERTGPYVPPITFPGISDVVITDDLRRKLERTPFELEFKSVWKKRIARIDWHEWDMEADEPAFYPKGGEPEDYILSQPHDPAIAEAMGDLWEIVIPEKPGLQLSDCRLDSNLYDGESVTRASRWGCLYVASSLKRWLQQQVPEWVKFEKATIATTG